MYKTGLSLILLLSVSLLPFNLHAQSGRKTSEPKPTKTEPAKTADDGITETNINPDGETVEGDVIRFDTSLVTVPVTVMDRNGRYVPLLRREHFRLSGERRRTEDRVLRHDGFAIQCVLLIDTSGSTQPATRRHSGRCDQVRRETQTHGQRDGDVV